MVSHPKLFPGVTVFSNSIGDYKSPIINLLCKSAPNKNIFYTPVAKIKALFRVVDTKTSFITQFLVRHGGPFQ